MTAAQEGDDDKLMMSSREEEDTTSCNVISPVDTVIGIDSGDQQHHSPAAWSDENVAFVARLWELTDEETRDLKELGRRLLQTKKNTSSDSKNGGNIDDDNDDDDNDSDSWEFVARHTKTKDPLQVVRFLRARPGNVDAAEIMFRNMIAWRRRNNVDSILENYTPPAEIVQHFPGAILQGLDKDGDPIFLSRTGVTDGAGLVQKYGRDEMIRHAIWLRELVARGEWIQECEEQQQQPQRQPQQEDSSNNNNDLVQGQQQQPRLALLSRRSEVNFR